MTRSKERLAIAEERIREFVILADQILENPAVQTGLQTTFRWVAATDTAPSSMEHIEPNQHLMKSALLDLRNLVQPDGFLRLTAVIDDIYSLTKRADLRTALRESRKRFDDYMAVRFVGIEGDDRSALELVEVWLYGVYHHRDRERLREIRGMDPLVRVGHRTELIEWMRNLCHEVMMLRYIAVHAGLAEAPPELPEEIPPDSPRAAAEALMGHAIAEAVLLTFVNRAGGRVEWEGSEIAAEIGEAAKRLGVRVQPKVVFRVTGRAGEPIKSVVVELIPRDSPDRPPADFGTDAPVGPGSADRVGGDAGAPTRARSRGSQA
jgi:hypothetical protein